MEYAGNIQRMLFSGHLGIEKLLNEAPLNLLSCPFSYGLRGYTNSHAFMNPVDSARLHNILPIGENDISNYQTPEYSDTSGIAIFSLHDSVVENRRMRLLGAMHGAFIRYLALYPNVDIFADPGIIRTIAEDNLLIEKLKAKPIGAPGQIAVVSSPVTWTKIWRLPQKRVNDFAGKIRDTVMRTGRDPVFLIFQDYLKMSNQFQYAVIPLPGLLGPEQKAELEKRFGKLPWISQDDGALILCDGKWEVVKDDLKSVWEKLATQDAKQSGFGTVWYVGQNFRYTWDGKNLTSR